MANPTDILTSLRGDYDESTGYTGNPNSNQILGNYFKGGGSLSSLLSGATGENGESIIPQGLLTSALNQYYGTINPSSLNSPQAFQAATGNAYGLNSAYATGAPGSGINLPNVTPAGYVPFTQSDIAQVQGMGGKVYDPNNITTINGLTYTPRSNIYVPSGGDFLSKYGPALASLAFTAGATSGAFPGAGAGGLVGGASSELGAVGGAGGGASLATGGGGLVGGAAGGALAGAAGGGAAIAPTQILGISSTPAAPSTIGGIPTGGAELSTGTAAPVSAAPSAAAPTASAPAGGLTGGASGGTLAGAIGAVPATAGADSILQQILGTAKDVFNSPILKGVSEIGSVAVPAVLGAKQLQQSADLQGKALDLQQQQIDNTQPALNAANQSLQEYAAGTISPSQQAAIDDWTQQASAQLKNAYAKMGLTGSSMEASALAQIAQKGAADKAQFVQQNFSNAMQALGLANNVYSGITQSELQSSQGMQSALTALGQALGNASAKLAA